MAIRHEKERFAENSVMRSVTAAVASMSKPLLVTAPLIGTALFIASGSQAQTSGSTAQPSQPTASTTVAPKPAPADARHRGPKGGGRDKEDTGRTETPSSDEAPVEERRKGPKGRGDSGRTETTPAPDVQPAARGGKPKPAVSHGVTETPTAAETTDAARKGGPKPDKGSDNQGRIETPAVSVSQADEQRRGGPKGRPDHGRTEPTPTPDAQPAARGTKPKGRPSHGRTATTPLLIGALSAAAVLALVVSSGNDTPTSP